MVFEKEITTGKTTTPIRFSHFDYAKNVPGPQLSKVPPGQESIDTSEIARISKRSGHGRLRWDTREYDCPRLEQNLFSSLSIRRWHDSLL